ncbi:MAG TPA: TetR/AcrR family transcriptional regulator [Candidatus Sulfotelmatobacter sp.]|nr:TetR/AcrR family transcriptional regulator [Candidatus Sulfotelmatobacter sp.]
MQTRPLRADAARNRHALLAAACACFARGGRATQMDEVASAAGVGIGTLYRHFPTKLDLVGAILAEQLGCFAARARQADGGSAWDRLTALLREMLRSQSENRSLSEISTCEVAKTRPELGERRRELHDALDALMRAAVDEGALRGDVGVDDVLCFVFNAHLTERDDAWCRYAEVVIDGLRARGAKSTA